MGIPGLGQKAAAPVFYAMGMKKQSMRPKAARPVIN